MYKKCLLYIVLLIGLTSLLTSQAQALTLCKNGYTYPCIWSGNTCVRFPCKTSTGSLICTISASGLGNCADNLYLGCTAEANSNINPNWVVACGNPGSKNMPAPGIQTTYYNGGGIDARVQVTPKTCDRNGNAIVTATGELSSDVKQLLKDTGVCDSPNPGWSVIDAVPCAMTLWFKVTDEQYNTTVEIPFLCTLPDCASLQWDKARRGFEVRDYECVPIN